MISDVRAVLREHQLMVQVLADEQLDADIKLFVLCTMAYVGGLREKGKRLRGGEHWLGTIAAMAHPGWEVRRQWAWVRLTVASDMPRYTPDRLPGAGCVQIRPDGQMCGKKPHVTEVERQPITGQGRQVAYCTTHWSHDRSWKLQAQEKAWRANGKPEPAPNTGGHLVRYVEFTNSTKEIWDGYYRWALQYSGHAQPSAAFTGARGLSVIEGTPPPKEGAEPPGDRPALHIVSANIT